MLFLCLFKRPKPVFKKPRYRCPFYGFRTETIYAEMLDQGGSQCAFYPFTRQPCRMEAFGKAADWTQCNFNRLQEKEARRTITNLVRAKFRIYPEEFNPGIKHEWKGLSFKQWFCYVMSRKVERPKLNK